MSLHQQYQASQKTETQWMRLRNLLETQHVEILNREKDNERRAYLYNVGEYWMAFEHSAWQLCQLFPQSTVAIFYLKTYPFPIVMASVLCRYAQPYFQQHIVRTFEDYTILFTSAFSLPRYRKWHRDTVNRLR